VCGSQLVVEFSRETQRSDCSLPEKMKPVDVIVWYTEKMFIISRVRWLRPGSQPADIFGGGQSDWDLLFYLKNKKLFGVFIMFLKISRGWNCPVNPLVAGPCWSGNETKTVTRSHRTVKTSWAFVASTKSLSAAASCAFREETWTF